MSKSVFVVMETSFYGAYAYTNIRGVFVHEEDAWGKIERLFNLFCNNTDYTLNKITKTVFSYYMKKVKAYFALSKPVGDNATGFMDWRIVELPLSE